MGIDFLSPQVFDAFIIINIVLGAALALRRFVKDLKRPLQGDAPVWAREGLDDTSPSDRA